MTLDSVNSIVASLFTQSPPSLTTADIHTITSLFSHLEIDSVRKAVMPFVKFDSWVNISDTYREYLFAETPKLETMYEKATKTADTDITSLRYAQTHFVTNLIDWVISECMNGSEKNSASMLLFTLLLSQLPTRRVVRAIFIDRAWTARVGPGVVSELIGFPVNDFSGEQEDPEIASEKIYEAVRKVFFEAGETELGLASSASLFGSADRIRALPLKLEIATRVLHANAKFLTDDFLVEKLLIDGLMRKTEMKDEVMFPTEDEIDATPTFPPSLQYLTLSHFLSRNSILFRREVVGILRNALADTVPRVLSGGSARMMGKVGQIKITKITRNSLSVLPKSVHGELLLDLVGVIPNVRAEWDQLGKGDVVFLVSLRDKPELVRGCIVEDLLDMQGNVLSRSSGVAAVGEKRIVKFKLDPVQYTKDLDSGREIFTTNSMYLLRLRPGESAFRSVIESIRGLGNKKNLSPVLPEWFHDFFLGYGVPQNEVVLGEDEESSPIVRSLGMLVVHSPPHSGVIQLVSELTRSLPGRILLVSKTNERLNEILRGLDGGDRIMKLGGAQEDEFSRSGRIDYILRRRMELLEKVKKFATAMGFPSDYSATFGYNCDNAKKFLKTIIQPVWAEYERVTQIHDKAKSIEKIIAYIQSTVYVPGFLKTAIARVEKNFKKEPSTHELLMTKASALLDLYSLPTLLHPFGGEFDYDGDIRPVFDQLTETAPFEILKHARERGEFLTTCHAKILAGTCTAVINQRVNLDDVQFSTVVFDESHQMTELETFLCLANFKPLTRIIMIGDSNRIGPIENVQTLFSRMIALGASQIHLNKIQCHSDIFLLWAWKYEGLVLQPGTIQNPLFQHACQFIDIPLYQGKGELEPSPHFFQNLGEAEYIVTLFLLLRLKGVRAESITVLCAYNGQRMLIEDIMRAKSNDVFGRPREITTIDQFQGMSNKVVLVSLVRTEHVGYLNDVRRWISATGSATEGLYMFGKLELFSDMSEAHYPVIEKLVQKPTKLAMNINGTSTIVEDVNHMFQIVQQEMKNEISRNGM
jgi:hypothetical protein